MVKGKGSRARVGRASSRGRRALILGAGHNGLVAAYYLARAGWQVRLLERRGVVGGAAVTEEFHPGFRNSVASYTVSLLNPAVIREMDLAGQGLRVVPRPVANFLPFDDGRYLKMGGGLARTQAEVARFSGGDAARLPDYYATLERVADVLRDVATMVPPRLDGSLRDWPALARHGWRLRSLAPADRQELLRMLTQSARVLLDEWFESDAVKAAFGFDAIVGSFTSPDAAGSGYVLLHHVWGEVNGERGAWGHAIGGMGAITQAMWRACAARGVEVELNTAVREVLLENGRAVGALSDDGRRHEADVVLSNLGPKLLFGQLMPELTGANAVANGTEFAARLRRFRTGSGTLRMNVALSDLPEFSCLPTRGMAEHHQSGIVIAPTLDYMDRAWLDARREGWSREPIVELLIPSTVDYSLAPAGAHVASLFCQQFAPKLPDGRSWDEAREQVADLAIDTVTRFAPNFRRSVIARQVLTPLDLERTFGLVDGDISHGHLALDQLWAARPTLGYGSYRTPVSGLYLCGAGAHPGGGVSGLPGRNCARVVIAEAG